METALTIVSERKQSERLAREFETKRQESDAQGVASADSTVASVLWNEINALIPKVIEALTLNNYPGADIMDATVSYSRHLAIRPFDTFNRIYHYYKRETVQKVVWKLQNHEWQHCDAVKSDCDSHFCDVKVGQGPCGIIYLAVDGKLCVKKYPATVYRDRGRNRWGLCLHTLDERDLLTVEELKKILKGLRILHEETLSSSTI